MGRTGALLELFLEIEKHSVYRAHSRLVLEARQELSYILATDNRLVQAALGRGMASEMDNIEEVAVLVCGLHDKVESLESVINKLRIIEKIAHEMADQLEVDNPNCSSLSKYFDFINKPIPYEEYKDFEQGQPFGDER